MITPNTIHHRPPSFFQSPPIGEMKSRDVTRQAGSGKSKYSWSRSFAWMYQVLLASALMTGCGATPYKVDVIDYDSPQKKALILISDPQVYSRASLINDRRNEGEYLKQLLENSKVDDKGGSVIKFTPQIIRDLKTVEALSANLGLSFGKTTSDATSANEVEQQIQVTKLQTQLAVLKKQLESINNAAAPLATIPSPDLAAAANSPPSSSSNTIAWPDVTQLHSAISVIQKQLKDMVASGTGGPTPPSNTYSALADARDDLIDRQAYRRDVRAALSEAQLDNTHDRGGNALYRLQFQATVLPLRGDNKQWGAVKVEIEAPRYSKAQVKTEYLNWLHYISTTVSDAQLGPDGKPIHNPHHDYDYDAYVGQLAGRGYFRLIDVYTVTPKSTPTNPYYSCYDHTTASPSQLKASAGSYESITYRREATYAVPPMILDECVKNKYPTDGPLDFHQKLAASAKQLLDAWIPVGHPQHPTTEIMQLIENKGLDSQITQIKTKFENVDPLAIVPTQFCMAIFGETKNNCSGFFNKDDSYMPAVGADPKNITYSVKSYSVLPSELMQRLGVTTEASQSLQTALTVAAQLKTTERGSLDIGYLSQSDARAQALARQPLVVGFSGSAPTTNTALSSEKNLVGMSYFGWLFGPQFTVKDSNTLSLQQSVRNYGTTAEVSIPGWWNNLALKVSSAWVSDWSSEHIFDENGCPPQAGIKPLEILGNTFTMDTCKAITTRKRISLPITDNTYESLTNYIAATDLGIQHARLFAQYVVPNVVPACTSKVTFQISGANIWRADSIFLGGVKADDVSVLPDMNGVAAVFDMNKVFGNLVNTDTSIEKVPLTVSAEQGSSSPLAVYIVGLRKSSNGATACQSPLFVPTTLAAMPPTVISVIPGDICSDTKTVPLVVQGINFDKLFNWPMDTLDSNEKTLSLNSEYFEISNTPSCNNDGALYLNLSIKKDAKGIPSARKHAIVLSSSNGASLPISINVIDCNTKVANSSKPQAKLETSSVKKAKDQSISLTVDVPDGYSFIKIAVRPQTKSNDHVWLQSNPIEGIKAGSGAKVIAKLDLTSILANSGDKLDVAVIIQSNSNKIPQEIPADKPLELIP